MSRNPALKFATQDAMVQPKWWEWEVWVDESPEVLESIEEVEYVLHSTFPERVRVKTDPQTKFRLKSGGWGTFNILVNIRMKDGTEHSQVVPLVFRDRASVAENAPKV